MSLLVNQSQVNADTGFFAPASGGGGGGGPNLTLSSITFGTGPDANGDNILMGAGGLLNLAAVGDSNQIQIGSLGGAVGIGNQYGIQGNFDNGAGGDITFADGQGLNSAWVGINYQNSGLAGPVSTVIYRQVVMPGDLQVSSINGATPGGGVPPNLTLSTLSVSSIGGLGGKGTLALTAPVNTSADLVVGGNLTTSGGQLSIQGGATTLAFVGGTGNISGLSSLNGISLVDAVVGANPIFSSITVNGALSNVSSINGSAYPPAASGITRTTVATLNGVSIPATASNLAPVPITGNFNTTAGHLYQLVGSPYLQVSLNASSNSAFQFQLGNLDRAYTSASPATPFRTDIAVFGNQPGLFLQWRSSGNYSANVISASMYDPLGDVVSSFTNASADLTLYDLGPVA